jgi:preprotein translocase subunit SecA
MIAGLTEDTVRRFVPPESVEDQWDIPGLESTLASEFQMQVPVAKWLQDDPELTDDKLRARVAEQALAQYAGKEQLVGADLMRQFERSLMLQTLDSQWRDHLANLDHLRQGIHLRGYAQKNPKQEYKRESFELFSDMLDRIKQDVVKIVLTVQVRTQEDVAAVEEAPAMTNVQYRHAEYAEALAGPDGDGEMSAAAAPAAPFVRGGNKIGRNDPCPCGSGKKYKQCHGRLA